MSCVSAVVWKLHIQVLYLFCLPLLPLLLLYQLSPVIVFSELGAILADNSHHSNCEDDSGYYGEGNDGSENDSQGREGGAGVSGGNGQLCKVAQELWENL